MSKPAQQLQKDVRKWFVASQKLKITSTLCYARIKANLVQFEAKANKSEVTQMQSDLGKYFTSKNFYNKKFLPQMYC